MEHEFKNKFFAQGASTLGMKPEFSTPYYPQDNGCMINVYNFLKTCKGAICLVLVV